MGHTDDVKCLAIHPDGRLVATGQIGPKPTIFLWDSQTMQEIACLHGTLTKGVQRLAFSDDGSLLAATGMDEEHTLAVYDVSSAKKGGTKFPLITSGKGSKANVLHILFSPDSKQVVLLCLKEVQFVSF